MFDIKDEYYWTRKLVKYEKIGLGILAKMLQVKEQYDRDRSLDKQLRIFERRLTRLEETQLTNREVNLAVDRVSAKMDSIEDRITARLDWLEARFDRLEMRFNDLDRKLDLVISPPRDRSKVSND